MSRKTNRLRARQEILLQRIAKCEEAVEARLRAVKAGEALFARRDRQLRELEHTITLKQAELKELDRIAALRIHFRQELGERASFGPLYHAVVEFHPGMFLAAARHKALGGPGYCDLSTAADLIARELAQRVRQGLVDFCEKQTGVMP